MTPNELHECYQKGFEQGQNHNNPSPQTITMIENIEKSMDRRFEDLKELLKERFDRNEAEHKILQDYQKTQNGNVARLVEFKNKQENSNKWVYGLCTLIILPLTFLFIEYFI